MEMIEVLKQKTDQYNGELFKNNEAIFAFKYFIINTTWIKFVVNRPSSELPYKWKGVLPLI